MPRRAVPGVEGSFIGALRLQRTPSLRPVQGKTTPSLNAERFLSPDRFNF